MLTGRVVNLQDFQDRSLKSVSADSSGVSGSR